MLLGPRAAVQGRLASSPIRQPSYTARRELPRRTAPAGSVAARPCVAWSPRPGSGSTISSRRCSCARASTSRCPSRRCPAWCNTPGTRCAREVDELAALGVPAVILFGVPERKDPDGLGRLGPRRHRAGRAARPARRSSATTGASWPISASTSTPTTGTAASSTDDGSVDNDATLELYAQDRRGPGRRGRRCRGAERDDGRSGRWPSVRRSTTPATARSPSAPTPPSTPRRSTGRSVTPSTSPSPTVATARATSRTGATPARRWTEIRLRPRRGRRHGHGQAGRHLPRRHRRGPGRARRAPSPRITCRASTR